MRVIQKVTLTAALLSLTATATSAAAHPVPLDDRVFSALIETCAQDPAACQRPTRPRAARNKVRPRSAAIGNSQRDGGGAVGNDVWMALARCEAAAGQDSRNGLYHGFFQFRLDTWRSVGESGDPHTYSYEHQRAAAQRLQARSGWGQWPSCSRRLGLR